MKIYLASSWRNTQQPNVVEALRLQGYEVYDFKNPGEGQAGFRWSDFDPNWKSWTPEEYRKAMDTTFARDGYLRDRSAIELCDVCILLLPAGRSASWELGYATGLGKCVIVAVFEAQEPELMYHEADIVTTMPELLENLKNLDLDEVSY